MVKLGLWIKDNILKYCHKEFYYAANVPVYYLKNITIALYTLSPKPTCEFKTWNLTDKQDGWISEDYLNSLVGKNLGKGIIVRIHKYSGFASHLYISLAPPNSWRKVEEYLLDKTIKVWYSDTNNLNFRETNNDLKATFV